MSGLFFSVEGIDGAGKSSHIEPLAQTLRDRGLDVVITREPGGTPLAEKLRAMILNDAMDPLTEALLAFAARRDHVVNVIRPALERGQAVICDRFTDSTVAYQGFGRGFERWQEVLAHLERWVQLDSDGHTVLQPDLTLWYDLSPAVAAKRLQSARAPDRFESQMETFFDQVRAGYASRMHLYPDRIRRVNADQLPQDVFVEVMAVVNERLDALTQASVTRPCFTE